MKKIFVLLILAIFALLFVATLRNSSEPEENYEMLQHIIIDDTSQLVSIAESQDYVPIHSFGVRIDNWVINNSCTQSYQNYYQHEQIGYFTPGISPNHGKIPVREKILLDVSWDDRYLLLTRSGTLSVYSLERDLLVDQPMNVELDNIATADWSVNNQIVFESDRDIYILDLATDEVSNVTSSREREYFPQWTPDGEKLVFVRVYENPERMVLFEYDVHEQTLKRLFTHIDIREPKFNANGEVIYFFGLVDSNLEAFSYSMSANEVTRRTFTSDMSELTLYVCRS